MNYRTRIVYLIPLADGAMWATCGWTVETLPAPHGFYSVLAWRYE